MAKKPLVRLGRGDVGLVDDHDVNVAGRELGQQVVGVITGAEGVEVGDDLDFRPDVDGACLAIDRSSYSVIAG